VCCRRDHAHHGVTPDARDEVREVLRLLADDGWIVVETKGSHRQLKHPTKPGRVTVAGKPSDDLARGTLNSILRQAGLKERP
jgi:predicted RNA binding protein YcfA (HicA-like mRNA interferase family)